jgi:hypothetical protein
VVVSVISAVCTLAIRKRDLYTEIMDARPHDGHRVVDSHMTQSTHHR